MRRFSQVSAVTIPVGQYTIEGDLRLPGNAKAVVIFAHGSGSSRHSPRNKYVAETLNQAGLGTLLIDLLTVEEELVDMQTAEHRFDIRLLADRLIAATDWLGTDPRLSNLAIGYFGASTGAAAAVMAAAERRDRISAVVSRGGRPDLAKKHLDIVTAPTLFIVGEFDSDVIEFNRIAARAMRAPNEIEIVPGATHLFEEEGALEQVAALAREWFEGMTMSSRLPERGQILPEVSGTASDGRTIRVSDLRGRKNIVVVVFGQDSSSRFRELVAALADRFDEVQNENAEIISVAPSTSTAARTELDAHLPFPVIRDSNNEIHRSFGAIDARRKTLAAVCIADKYGEVYFAQFCSDADCPTAQDVLEWLRFIEIQCPECGVAEWPRTGS